MSTSGILQIISSFLLGGALITFLSLWAERTTEKKAGIILMFPTTIAFGLFFLGLNTSPQKVASIIPSILIPLGTVVFSSVIYIYTALFYSYRITSKKAQILATLITSSIIWFIIISPIAYWKLNDLFLGMCGYFILMILSHYILNRKKDIKQLNRLKYSGRQIAFRAIFVGGVIAIIVLMGKMLNPFWGGIFTMYPAVTFSGLMIFHFYYEPEMLFFFMRKAPIGSLSVFAFAVSVMFFFPLYGLIIGTTVSYIVSLALSITLTHIQRKLPDSSV